MPVIEVEHLFPATTITPARTSHNNMSFGGSLVPSGNKLFGSSFNDRTQGPHMLELPEIGWDLGLDMESPPSGSTPDWYQRQSTTKFTCVQHRKERAGPFFHEFIVVELDNNTVCRFDRRGDPTTRANAFTTEGITAEDTAHVIQKHEPIHYDKIYETSDVLLQINLPDGEDLKNILSTCRAIQHCETTRSYSLLQYNCYFFSWAILTIVVHFTVGNRRS